MTGFSTDFGKDLEIQVPPESGGERLDRFLPASLAKQGLDHSRSAIQTLIKSGGVRVDGRIVKPRHAVSDGEVIQLRFTPTRLSLPLPEEIALVVLYEDDDLIVVNKEVGLVVHPASGNFDGTLVNALLHHCSGNLCSLAGADRPGIVHRLDKDTSGCLVAAKSELAYHSLVAQFSARETGKEYIAVTDGIPVPSAVSILNRIGRHPVNRQKMAVVEAPAGKDAASDFCIIRSDEKENWASLSCIIHTGRTHQIRVHCKESLRCPILGDPIYSHIPRQSVKVLRLMLHAYRLAFRHPVTGERVNFEAPLPEDFLRFV